MLAVFEKSVAKGPDALQTPNSESVSALKDGFLAGRFSSEYPGSVTINLGSAGFMAYTSDKQNPLIPRFFLFLLLSGFFLFRVVAFDLMIFLISSFLDICCCTCFLCSNVIIFFFFLSIFSMVG